jgi:hypothetical protein
VSAALQLGVAVDDVVAHVPVNRNGSCRMNPMRCARLGVKRADVAAVEQHAAARRIVEARHQRRGRGLAAAGRADQRVGLAALERERRVAQDPGPHR